MKQSAFDGISMVAAGYKPLTEEEREKAKVGSEYNPERVFPTIYANTKDIPVDFDKMGVKAGDKLYFCGVVNISEIRPVDRAGVTEPEPTSFTLEILQIGFKPMEKTSADYVAAGTDASLNKLVEPTASRVYGGQGATPR